MVAGLVVWLLIVTNIITILYIFKLKDRPLTKYDVLNWLGGKNSADRDGMLNDIVDCIYGGQKSIGFKPYKLNPKKPLNVGSNLVVGHTHTAAMARRFPETAKVNLSHLGVVGILNVDNPHDPRNREALP